MPLCDACLRAMEGKPVSAANVDPDRTRIHHYTIVTFICAKDEDCYICSAVYGSLTLSFQMLLHELVLVMQSEDVHWGEQGHFSQLDAFVQPGDNPTEFVVVTDFTFVVPPSDLYTICDQVATTDGRWTNQNTCQLKEEIEAPNSGFNFSKRMMWYSFEDHRDMDSVAGDQCTPRRTNSPQVFDQIERWIDDCLSNHPSCRPPDSTPRWYPTRLIRIGDLDQEGRVTACHLVDGVEAAGRGERYATVSHRWGSDQFATLKTSNMANFRVEVPMRLISQTLVDCMEVARRLGIRYVWIDSLCIIQSGNGLQDWLTESIKMDLVYSNGFCNIMAGWGTAQNGMFFDRDPELLRAVTAKFAIASSNTVVTTREGTRLDRNWWKKEVDDSPLNGRAWILQERVLSQRNLHFGRHQVLWECAECIRSERSPHHPTWSQMKLPSHVGLDGFHVARELRLKPVQTSNGGPTTHADYQLWMNVVTDYCKRDITNVSDKLVALSGVAKLLKGKFNDLYLCGLWKQNIAHEVLWSRLRGAFDPSWSDWILQPSGDSHVNNGLAGQGPYFVPSFSWASIHNPPRGVALAFAPEFFESLVAVDCVKYRPPEAAVQRKHVWVDSPITADAFGLVHEPLMELRVVGRVLPCKLVSGDRIHLELRPIGSPSLKFPHAVGLGTRLFIDNPIASSEVDTFLARTYYYVSWRRGIHATILQGLILELEDEEMARYRRIGLLVEGTSDTGHSYLQPWGHESEVPCWGYDELPGKHTIYIV